MDLIRIAAKTWFTVNALNRQKFTGTVQEISPAAASEFSVLEPDNSTYNFTKFLQRISVRVAINPNKEDLENLSSGMSMLKSVD